MDLERFLKKQGRFYSRTARGPIEFPSSALTVPIHVVSGLQMYVNGSSGKTFLGAHELVLRDEKVWGIRS